VSRRSPWRKIPAPARGAVRRSLPVVCALLLLALSTARAAPIHEAARAGDLEALTRLIEEGADVNAARPDGITPLHWAAQEGRIEVVRLLLSRGADPSIRAGNGWTPLHYAAASGHDEILALLRRPPAGAAAKKRSPLRPKKSPSGRPPAASHHVQLAAFRSGPGPARAEKRRLLKKFGRQLEGVELVVRKAEGKKGPVYRVETAPMPKEKARGLCRRLKRAGQGCLVVRSGRRS